MFIPSHTTRNGMATENQGKMGWKEQERNITLPSDIMDLGAAAKHHKPLKIRSFQFLYRDIPCLCYEKNAPFSSMIYQCFFKLEAKIPWFPLVSGIPDFTWPRRLMALCLHLQLARSQSLRWPCWRRCSAGLCLLSPADGDAGKTSSEINIAMV